MVFEVASNSKQARGYLGHHVNWWNRASELLQDFEHAHIEISGSFSCMMALSLPSRRLVLFLGVIEQQQRRFKGLIWETMFLITSADEKTQIIQACTYAKQAVFTMLTDPRISMGKYTLKTREEETSTQRKESHSRSLFRSLWLAHFFNFR